MFAGVGSDELFEERTVDLCTASRQIICLGVAPQTTEPKRRDFCTELRPGATGKTAG
jgi:hypothetical protein